MAVPCVATIATSATTPSDTAIGTLTSTSASTAANSPSMMLIGVRPFSADRRPARRRPSPVGGARGHDQIDQVRDLGDHDQRRRDRDHRLHDVHRHPRQADHRVAGEHRHDRRRRRTPSTTKNAITTTCATMLTIRRARHGSASTTSGQPMCARLHRRQRRPVEREPREQHRRDLVVPDERVPDRAEDDARRDLDDQHDHQRADHPFEQAAVTLAEPPRASRPRGASARRAAGMPPPCGYFPSATARSITSFAPGTSLPNSS